MFLELSGKIAAVLTFYMEFPLFFTMKTAYLLREQQYAFFRPDKSV